MPRFSPLSGNGEKRASDRRVNLYLYYDWDSFALSIKNQLSVQALQFELEVGFFTALQMLTDIYHKCSYLVSLPMTLGTGVCLDIHFTADGVKNWRRTSIIIHSFAL